MKATLITILITLLSYPDQEINKIRKLYITAPQSKVNCESLGSQILKNKKRTSPLIIGYEGCYYLIRCKFTSSPFKKTKWFNKGRDLLEYSIKKDPKSVELRFLRYAIQKKLPRFLLYSDNLERDYTFIQNNLNNITNKETLTFIKSSLKSIEK